MEDLIGSSENSDILYIIGTILFLLILMIIWIVRKKM